MHWNKSSFYSCSEWLLNFAGSVLKQSPLVSLLFPCGANVFFHLQWIQQPTTKFKQQVQKTKRKVSNKSNQQTRTTKQEAPPSNLHERSLSMSGRRNSSPPRRKSSGVNFCWFTFGFLAGGAESESATAGAESSAELAAAGRFNGVNGAGPLEVGAPLDLIFGCWASEIFFFCSRTLNGQRFPF